MSRKSQLSIVAILSSAMVLAMMGVGFAQQFAIPPEVILPDTNSDVTEFDDEGLKLTLPSKPQIGRKNGPQAPSASGGSSSGVSGGSFRDDCEIFGCD